MVSQTPVPVTKMAIPLFTKIFKPHHIVKIIIDHSAQMVKVEGGYSFSPDALIGYKYIPLPEGRPYYIQRWGKEIPEELRDQPLITYLFGPEEQDRPIFFSYANYDLIQIQW